MTKIAVIGGGAAGFFGAIHLAKFCDVTLFEKTKVPLSKVRVSGGGRCNVTHHCFDPKELVKHYPRGNKELLGPFHRFQPKDTMEWFESRKVALKIEDDGRVFPVSDSSQTIIDCLMNEARDVDIKLLTRIEKIEKGFTVYTKETHHFDKILLTSGSAIEGFEFAKSLGHTIVPPVPSLFTFNVPDSPLKELSGIAVDNVSVKAEGLEERGALLITHFGFSGPAILRLSAWGARILNEKKYQGELIINWIPDRDKQELLQLKKAFPQTTLLAKNPFSLPKNLWKKLTESHLKKLGEMKDEELHQLFDKLQNDPYTFSGKTTHKEEFVTAGGIHLKEVNFKTMESKLCPGLFFAGEILDIDGITGGFNFQNAWTTSWIAAHSMY